MIGYKVVVKQKSRHLTSACMYGPSSMIRYRMNRVARPKRGNGPLAVFDTLGHAIAFAAPWTQVYRCRWVQSKHRKLWTCYKSWATQKPRKDVRYTRFPEGTCFASSVTLLRRVQ